MEEKEDENNDRKVDRVDADADAVNAGPDRADKNDRGIDDKGREDENDDVDADAIADNAGANQIDKPKEAVGDQDLKFANEVSEF